MAFMTNRGCQRELMQRQLTSNDFVGRLDTADKTRYMHFQSIDGLKVE